MPVQVLVAAAAILLLVGWWVTERRANGTPRTEFFAGSIALLQDVREPNELALDRDIGVLLSAASDNPAQVQVAVVVCGGIGLPFRAQLIFTGDARLNSAFWVNPAALDGGQQQAEPVYDDRRSLQIFTLEMDVVHAICPGEDVEDAGIFGQAATITGAIQQPHTRSFSYWGVGTARGTVALPSLGHIPADSAIVPDFVPRASVPFFGGPYTNLDPLAEVPELHEIELAGLTKPFGLKYQSLVQIAANQRPELLTQAEDAQTGLTSIRWRSSEPTVVYTRLINDDVHASHRSQLALMTMMFGIATSVLAAALWSSFDRSAAHNKPAMHSHSNAPATHTLGILAWVAAFALILFASSRKKDT